MSSRPYRKQTGPALSTEAVLRVWFDMVAGPSCNTHRTGENGVNDNAATIVK